MQEYASAIYEQLGSAINELEQDLEYNPMQFFGITMWPDTVNSFVSSVVTLAFGLFATNYLEPEDN